MKNWIKILLFFVTSFTLIGCDRITKDLAKSHLADSGSLSYFHDTFRLEYTENTGAAYGLGEHLSKPMNLWLLSIIPLVFLLILFIYVIRKSKEMSFLKMFLIALIFAGGVGNIIDRIIFHRHVTDFMNLGIQNFRTAIFNFADVYITIGVIAFVIFSYNKKII